MSELFDMPESKSPRLLWMERHGIKTRHEPKAEHPNGDWVAWVGEYESSLQIASDVSPGGCHLIEWGVSELDAICNLCAWNGWSLWNEE